MIRLQVEEYCNNCSEFEPEVDRDMLYCDDILRGTKMSIIETRVQCKHRSRCKSIKDYLAGVNQN